MSMAEIEELELLAQQEIDQQAEQKAKIEESKNGTDPGGTEQGEPADFIPDPVIVGMIDNTLQKLSSRFAPNWNITKNETVAVATLGDAVLEKYLPSMIKTPEGALAVTVVGIFVSRMGTPRFSDQEAPKEKESDLTGEQKENAKPEAEAPEAMYG